MHATPADWIVVIKRRDEKSLKCIQVSYFMRGPSEYTFFVFQEDEDIVENFPAGLLRANYVVDLMKYPGELFKVGSHEARKITGDD